MSCCVFLSGRADATGEHQHPIRMCAWPYNLWPHIAFATGYFCKTTDFVHARALLVVSLHFFFWKLGATLANSRQSEAALPAYRRAIASKPGYARAWLNMGISQANLNRYEEASSCYLQALRLNPEAKHIWSYLRIVFSSMERFDLVQKAGKEDAGLFEDDFDLALPTPPP
ncbi:unnamed protein product [Ectocarpus sp. 12 AP-2014]